ncbi:hypothetical protein [Rufibacter hautae]|uniref:hypothetical protein n=1 Tax=Rufibacter hautae TaxID=2595005 RepID=UPI001680E6DB|nr:hypothetical protein [Rufibacter hautae]
MAEATHMERWGRKTDLLFAALALTAIGGMGTLAWLACSGGDGSRYAAPALVLLLLLYLALGLLGPAPKAGGGNPAPAACPGPPAVGSGEAPTRMQVSYRLGAGNRAGHPARKAAPERGYSPKRLWPRGKKEAAHL